MSVASVGTPQAQEILSPAVRELFAPMSAGLQDQFAKCRGSGKARERTCCVTGMGSGSVAYFVLLGHVLYVNCVVGGCEASLPERRGPEAYR